MRRLPADNFTPKQDLTCGQADKSGDAVYQGRLAGSVRADDTQYIPFVKIEANFVQRKNTAEVLVTWLT